MSIGSLSFAQGRDGRHDRGDDRQAQQRNDQRPGNNGRPDARDHRGDHRHDRAQNRGDNRNERAHNRGDNRNERANQYYYNARGDEWRRGGRVPNEYRNRTYHVNDWRAHRLSQPPRGHQWVQVGSDYVLMAVATGLIVQLLINQ